MRPINALWGSSPEDALDPLSSGGEGQDMTKERLILFGIGASLVCACGVRDSDEQIERFCAALRDVNRATAFPDCASSAHTSIQQIIQPDLL